MRPRDHWIRESVTARLITGAGSRLARAIDGVCGWCRVAAERAAGPSWRRTPLPFVGMVGVTATLTGLGVRLVLGALPSTAELWLALVILLLSWACLRSRAPLANVLASSRLLQWVRHALAERGASARWSDNTAMAQKQRTAAVYGHLWSRTGGTASEPVSHYRVLERFLPEGHLRGCVLDAGCGIGVDTCEMASATGVRVVAVDISIGGTAQTRRRAAGRRNVTVIRADLERLPCRDAAFDFVYSYGVVHHLPHPHRGFDELVRVLRPGGWLALYVYEDFSGRTGLEQALLAAANGLRPLTTRIPPPFLYPLCQLASPLIFATCTLPSRLLRRVPGGARVADRIPFRHGTTWFGLAGDLYDRFAAPIENRYGEATIRAWMAGAGLEAVQLVACRGWVACGRKPTAASQHESEWVRLGQGSA